jgi:glycyl-tRNA synthetase alpha subunit
MRLRSPALRPKKTRFEKNTNQCNTYQPFTTMLKPDNNDFEKVITFMYAVVVAFALLLLGAGLFLIKIFLQ